MKPILSGLFFLCALLIITASNSLANCLTAEDLLILKIITLEEYGELDGEKSYGKDKFTYTACAVELLPNDLEEYKIAAGTRSFTVPKSGWYENMSLQDCRRLSAPLLGLCGIPLEFQLIANALESGEELEDISCNASAYFCTLPYEYDDNEEYEANFYDYKIDPESGQPIPNKKVLPSDPKVSSIPSPTSTPSPADSPEMWS